MTVDFFLFFKEFVFLFVSFARQRIQLLTYQWRQRDTWLILSYIWNRMKKKEIHEYLRRLPVASI